ncbi:DUF3304 domain-containing protein [Pseudomonas sp. DWP3-1-2]|uniref:DUF3304 domain-containing protein n=1 Tax=Pseudomonas sp. DWP3-1-2 TaxID=2804645 RepID=UPI003CED38A2
MSEALTLQRRASKSRTRQAGVMTLLCMVVLATACTPTKSERGSAPIEGYNHTSAAINWFTVNGNGGSNFGPHMGGGSQTCCISLPRQWHPGLTVLVEWEEDPKPHDYGSWPERRFSDEWNSRVKRHRSSYTRHSAVVEVAPYEELGVLDVHFLPCDRLAVAAVAQLPGQPGYPFNYPYKMEVPAVCPKP